jgi:hypothetical protein
MKWHLLESNGYRDIREGSKEAVETSILEDRIESLRIIGSFESEKEAVGAFYEIEDILKEK